MLSAVSVIEGFRGGGSVIEALRGDVSTTEVLLTLSIMAPAALSVIEGCRLLLVEGLTDSGDNSLRLLKVEALGVIGDDLGMPPMYRDLFTPLTGYVAVVVVDLSL